MESLYLAIVLAPLLGALIAGLFGQRVGRAGAHWAAILGVAAAFAGSLCAFDWHILQGQPNFNGAVYTWLVSEGVSFQIGFLIDPLTVLMMLVVTFVSLMVHIYTIGYMADDPGYQRFFSYIALFTFAMLMLVMSNNFLQLFFGWEAVGLVSYLLIGFWYTRESAIFANLKAFLVNRVGDFGFLLGIAAIYYHFNSLDYAVVFANLPQFTATTVQVLPGLDWPLLSVIGILLFIGAMGKSAQMPLHVWLPDSMEGPTPISALIHAATMVTAGIFMVARLSPLYESAPEALAFILVIGALTAFLMGLIGLVQHDIKRVVAYSTLSQLGYMTAALGVSAYSVAIFHLMTHAFFKALLFLGAGAVIMAMHHEQDMRKMGGLKRYLPITYWTALIGSLALIGFPGFSGFYSKDLILEALHHRHDTLGLVVYMLLLGGVMITALYTFRMFFLVFHGKPRMDHHTREHLHEPGWVVTVPLILLAIPSLLLGAWTAGPVALGHYFDTAIVTGVHNVVHELAGHYHGPLEFALHGFLAPPFWLAMAGVAIAWYFFLVQPGLGAIWQSKFPRVHAVLEAKYGFDDFYQRVFAVGSVQLGQRLWRYLDALLIDDLLVNGAARVTQWGAGLLRVLQSGYLFHYAFAMIIGVLLLLSGLTQG